MRMNRSCVVDQYLILLGCGKNRSNFWFILRQTRNGPSMRSTDFGTCRCCKLSGIDPRKCLFLVFFRGLLSHHWQEMVYLESKPIFLDSAQFSWWL
jgi:hypothetical protein